MAEPFPKTKPKVRCKMCTSSLGSYVADRLRAGVEAGHPRPEQKTILRILVEEFAEEAPSANALRNHLQNHEPTWRDYGQHA